MKKTLLLIIFIIISLIGISQNKVTTSGIFETGYENRTSTIYLPDSTQQATGLLPRYTLKPFYGFLHLDVSYKGLKIYTSNKTYFSKDYSIYFNPIFSQFTIGASYTYKFFIGGYEHMCGHNFEYRCFGESYDRIYFRFKLF